MAGKIQILTQAAKLKNPTPSGRPPPTPGGPAAKPGSTARDTPSTRLEEDILNHSVGRGRWLGMAPPQPGRADAAAANRSMRRIARHLFDLPGALSGRTRRKVAGPAALYTVQNNCLYGSLANLDSATGEALLDLMAQLNEERGATFLFSTHDPAVMPPAHRQVSLRDGRVERDESH